MLSSRGALNMATLLVECASAQSKTSKKIFLLSEAEKVWTAFAAVLRSQLIQDIPVQVAKFGALWFESKLIVTDGPLKYYQRVPRFGFHGTFMTTYSLDPITVPSENLKVSYERLPIDQITTMSGVGAQTVQLILQEMFLYIGEALFNGRVLNLDFPGLMQIVMKREKAVVTFDNILLDDLFAIDSRKWPLAVREMASIARKSQGSDSRPTSASTRPRSASSLRPTTQPKALEPRPAFCSSAQAGRLFVEIQNLPQRQAPLKPQSPGNRRQPLKARQPATSQSNLAVPADEEESVYEVLSPERHNMHLREDSDAEVFCVGDAQEMPSSEFAADDAMPAKGDARDESDELAASCPITSQPTTAPPSRAAYHGASTVRDLLYGGGSASAEPTRVGRKRFDQQQRSNIAFMFQ